MNAYETNASRARWVHPCEDEGYVGVDEWVDDADWDEED